MAERKPTSWRKGQSGNPNGRPRKNRTLTTILERAGNAKTEGGKVAQKKVLADLLWEGATTGAVTFGDVTKPMDAQDWLGLVKFLYSHIDGPPKTDIELSGSVEVIQKGYVQVNPDDWDADQS